MTDSERERLTAVEQRASSNTHQISDIKEDVKGLRSELKEVQTRQEALYEINTNIQLMAQSISSVKEDVATVRADVKEMSSDFNKVHERVTAIESRPDKEIASNYRKYREQIVKILIAGIVAFILGQVAPTIF